MVSERNTGLGPRLRQLRKERSLTSQEVASAVGTTQSHLCAIETGRTLNPRINLLLAVSDYYGLTLSELVGQEEVDLSSLKGEKLRHWYERDLSEKGQRLLFRIAEELREEYRNAR